MPLRDPNIRYIYLPRRDGWMVTLTDMTYVLMTFFVLLLTMSSMDKKVFKDNFGFFNQGVGVLEFPSAKSQAQPPLVETNVLRLVDINSLTQSLKEHMTTDDMLIQSPPGDIYEIRQTPRGVAIGLKCDVVFDAGSATLRKEMLPVLGAIGRTLVKTRNFISVEGHTDNSGDVEQNMLLSRKRAQAVLDYFVYVMDMSPTRFSLAGYGPLAPRVPNNSEMQRERNRRVDILLLKGTY